MLLGTCVTNHNGDIGYTVSIPVEDMESLEWFVKVIWIDPLLRAAEKEELYPETLQVSNERQSDINPN